MADKCEDVNELIGDSVVGIEEARKFDLVLEFESGTKLRVYSAKWYLTDE